MPADPGDSSSTSAARTKARTWLEIAVVEDAGDWSGLRPVAEFVRAAGRALADDRRFATHRAAEVCVALSSDAAVRELNARYRGKDEPTNVLSFPAPAGDGALRLGDIVLAQETLAREAAADGIPVRHHLQHLVVHGLLHLLGFDHESDADAAEMEALEVGVLGRLGIADPYAPRPAAGSGPGKTAPRSRLTADHG